MSFNYVQLRRGSRNNSWLLSDDFKDIKSHAGISISDIGTPQSVLCVLLAVSHASAALSRVFILLIAAVLLLKMHDHRSVIQRTRKPHPHTAGRA